jgi:hypothetical protein
MFLSIEEETIGSFLDRLPILRLPILFLALELNLLELALHLPKTLFVLELFEFVHFDLLFNLFMSRIIAIKDHISCSNSVSPTDLELEAKESVSASYILSRWS